MRTVGIFERGDALPPSDSWLGRGVDVVHRKTMAGIQVDAEGYVLRRGAPEEDPVHRINNFDRGPVQTGPLDAFFSSLRGPIRTPHSPQSFGAGRCATWAEGAADRRAYRRQREAEIRAAGRVRDAALLRTEL